MFIFGVYGQWWKKIYGYVPWFPKTFARNTFEEDFFVAWFEYSFKTFNRENHSEGANSIMNHWI